MTKTGLQYNTSIKGMVFDIQRMCIHDGPGIRTTVFMKGCPLSCAWCHNPEGYAGKPQLAFTPTLCIGCGFCFRTCPRGAHVMEGEAHLLLRDRCLECLACTEKCYSGALEAIGSEQTVGEALGEVIKDIPFYEESGGGMTISGGEPLFQFEFTLNLLKGGRAHGLHTCLETCGHAPASQFESILPFVDLFLFDYKETDPEKHVQFTGLPNGLILNNLHFLDEQGAAIMLRCPIIPGFNLREDHINGIVQTAKSLRNCIGVHVMGHHGLGNSKRTWLGISERVPVGAELLREETEAVAVKLRALGAPNVSVS